MPILKMIAGKGIVGTANDESVRKRTPYVRIRTYVVCSSLLFTQK